MSKITMKDMNYYYMEFYTPVFENINLVIETDWKLGLVGRNGRGKTTLLKLLKGEIEPTGGTITTPFEMEYFPYESNCNYTKTLDVIKENIGHIKSMEDAMEAIIKLDTMICETTNPETIAPETRNPETINSEAIVQGTINTETIIPENKQESLEEYFEILERYLAGLSTLFGLFPILVDL